MATSTAPVVPVDGANYFGVNRVAKKSDLDMATFLRLLTVQLQNQNPLEPMNDRDFFAQMAQLGQVQGTDKLVGASQVAQANQLMGKTVTAVRPDASTNPKLLPLVSGIVTKLSIRNGVNYIGIQEADGGVVDVTSDALQSVTPTQKMSDYSNLLGKTVSGSGQATVGGKVVPAVGTVEGLSNLNGQIFVQVKTATYGMVPVRVGDIENIAN